MGKAINQATEFTDFLARFLALSPAIPSSISSAALILDHAKLNKNVTSV